MNGFLNWLMNGTPHQVWLRLFVFDLIMIPVSIVLFLFDDNRQYIYLALLWSVLALMGLFIREGLLRDRSGS